MAVIRKEALRIVKRQSGVLLPVFSLPGEYSCGSFGSEARAFVDALAAGGFSVWQVLPFCPADECNSPYKSYSAFSGNPYFIDLPDLHRRGLLTEEELSSAKQTTPYACEYERLARERMPLLAKAAARMTDRTPIEDFLRTHPSVASFCEFMGRRAAEGERPWYEWTSNDVDRETERVWQFAQYIFFVQWKELRAYANARGVRIVGDIPMYVSLDSADVWAEPEEFLLDAKRRPTAVAGVPPDYFSEDGQLWGNPLYNYAYMRKNGFAWWRRRMAAMAEMFDGVRIDHFRAFDAYFSIPVEATSAKAGAWKKGPGMALIRALREAAGDTFLIAEDLGDITPSVRALLKKSGLPGMRVLQFGFLSDGPSIHQPHAYVENCVAYTGTHDNNTLLGYMFEMPAERREQLMAYIGRAGEDFNRPTVYRAVLSTLLMSAAGLAVVPLQDLLMYGADTRINTPGRAEGNWTYRVTAEQLASLPWDALRDMNRTYGRTGCAAED